MKRFFGRTFIALLLILVCFSSSALAAYGYCTNCGKYADLLMYRCSSCRTGSSFTITEAKANSDGSVTIRWSDSNRNGPYTVFAALQEEAPKPFHWTDVENHSGTSWTYDWLVPGVDYKFYVEDSDGNRSSVYYYDAPYVYTVNEIGTKMEVTPCYGGLSETVSRFSSSTITRRLSSQQFGVYIKVNYSMLARARDYAYMFCVKAPNGYEERINGGSIGLPSGRSYWNKGYISLNSFFRTLNSWYEEIPVGTYTLTLYYDGDRVCSQTFYVGG